MIIEINNNSSPEEIRQALHMLKKSSDTPSKKHFDALKYCGVIKLKEDPLAIQKRIRDEWK
jgi:hypothetical protein